MLVSWKRSFYKITKIVRALTLNFIRLLRVVITPSATSSLRGENDSKLSDELQANAHSDWLRGVFAWEYVIVVASTCFAFRALITQARIWKRFQVQNSTSLLYLPIPSSAETWNIAAKKVCQSFFADILSEKSPYFGKHLFAKQELITCARLRGQHFATGKNFYFNHNYNKIVKSDWLSTALISALIGQFNRTVRVMPK